MELGGFAGFNGLTDSEGCAGLAGLVVLGALAPLVGFHQRALMCPSNVSKTHSSKFYFVSLAIRGCFCLAPNRNQDWRTVKKKQRRHGTDGASLCLATRHECA